MCRRVWRKARERAGLLLVRIHDLKHTFGRRLRAAGVSFEDRQDLLGHRSGRVTTHCSQAELENLIRASNKVCGNQSRTRCHHKELSPSWRWLTWRYCQQVFGTPDRIRTCDLRIRSPLLYPTELRAHMERRLKLPAGLSGSVKYSLHLQRACVNRAVEKRKPVTAAVDSPTSCCYTS
jgi:hypothetical protein